MTREEAVKLLQATRLMLMDGANQPISDLYYALDMAIEALEQTENSSEIPNNSTISKMEQVDKGINVLGKDELQKCSVNGRPYSECSSCEHFKCTADEPQVLDK